MNNKTGLFIMCRASSSRLPGKALAEIRGKTTLEHVIDRVKMIKDAGPIVLCTSTDSSDDVLVPIAESNGIEIHRGSFDDVLDRFLGAAVKFEVERFAVMLADNLFFEPQLVEAGIKQMIDDDLDFLSMPEKEGLIPGAGEYTIKTEALKKVCAVKKSDDTAFFPDFFYDIKDLRIGFLKGSDTIYYYPKIRILLDYSEDLDFFKRIFDEFDTDQNDVPLRDIIKLVQEKPEIGEINLFRSGDWEKNQTKQHNQIWKP